MNSKKLSLVMLACGALLVRPVNAPPVQDSRDALMKGFLQQQQAAVKNFVFDHASWRPFAQPIMTERDPAMAELDMASVAQAVDRTKTRAGGRALRALISAPTADMNELNRRLAVIHELKNNKQLFDALDALVSLYAGYEDRSLLSFYDPRDELLAYMEQHFKVEEEWWKMILKDLGNPLGIATAAGLLSPARSQQLGSLYFIPSTLATLATEAYKYGNVIKKQTQEKAQPYIQQASQVGSGITGIAQALAQGSLETAKAGAKSIGKGIGGGILQGTRDLVSAPFQPGSLTGGTIISGLFQVFQRTKDLATSHQKIRTAYERLLEVADALKRAEEIGVLAGKNLPQLAGNELKGLGQFVALMDDIRKSKPKSTYASLAVESLAVELQSGRKPWSAKSIKDFLYNIQSSIFQGNTVAIHEKATDVRTQLYLSLIADTFNGMTAMREKFIPMMQSVGYLDAYLSIVRLLQEREGQEITFSIPSFLADREVPYINFAECWTPLIPMDKAVANNVVLGGDNVIVHNALLSGPHGSGKSTIMRSIGHTALLGQSLCICPAKAAAFTPFKAVKTYMNITDNTKKGKSSFMAERERMNLLKESVERLKDGELSLVLVDEPYAKTIPSIAEQRIVEFALPVSERPMVILILATHFEKPTKVLESTPRFVVLHPEVLEPQVGQFVRTFRIIQGPAKRWLEDASWRERFIDWFDKKLAQDALAEQQQAILQQKMLEQAQRAAEAVGLM